MPLAFSQCAHDDALVIRLRAGDEQAYAELYRRVHPRVFGFALRRLGDPTEAEDVAQDVFLQVYRSIDRYEGRSSLLCWIFGIARHTTLNRFSYRSPEMTPLDEARGLARAGPVDRGQHRRLTNLGALHPLPAVQCVRDRAPHIPSALLARPFRRGDRA